MPNLSLRAGQAVEFRYGGTLRQARIISTSPSAEGSYTARIGRGDRATLVVISTSNFLRTI